MAAEARVRVEEGSREDVAWVPVVIVSARTVDKKNPIKEGCPVTSKNVPNAAPP